MSTGAGIPSYQQACLASDTRNSAVYLVGGSSSVAGLLEVNYISLTNINAPTIRSIGSNVNTLKWAAGAPKACFPAPSSDQANSVIKVIQFGHGASYMSYISPGGVVADPTSFAGLEFQSPKLFGWVGSFTTSNYNVFHMYAVSASPTTLEHSHWISLRLSFLTEGGSLSDQNTGLYPSAVDPLLSVGTYTPTSSGDSQGYSVVFDKQGKGQVFTATGSDQATVNNTISVLVLSNPGNVNMNGIVLSSDAVSVTMGDTGYILDKSKDANTIVLYSITPGSSSTLQKVSNNGDAPAFFPSLAVAALNKQIVVYSAPPGGTPYFNSFDTTTGTWGGINLIHAPGPSGSKSVGAIIGGVVGGLLVIALLAFLFFRRRNNRRRKAAAASIANANADKYAPEPSNEGMTELDNGGMVVPIEGQVWQGQQQQQLPQQAGYNYQPPIFDPYAQVQKPDEPLYVPYRPPTKFFEPYGGNQAIGLPVNYDTTGSQSSAPVYSASPFVSPGVFRTEPEPQNQQQHYSPVQQQQQQHHYSPIQQQQQYQDQQHFSPEPAYDYPMEMGAPISGASKSPQFIPQL
ncbi:hypothetical protein F5H01DRAFT_327173 [Linnemannia elongata]|nr:hypothetical protein F5H01DRAFT_327173 [Linnemannia elongata]